MITKKLLAAASSELQSAVGAHVTWTGQLRDVSSSWVRVELRCAVLLLLAIGSDCVQRVREYNSDSAGSAE